MPSTRFNRRLAALLALFAPLTAVAQNAEAPIVNTATLRFVGGNADATAEARVIASNTVTLRPGIPVGKQPTRISFRRFPPGFQVDTDQLRCEDGGKRFFADPVTAEEFALAQPLASAQVERPSIVVLENPGGNRDPTVLETSEVTVTSSIRSQQLVLTETDVNSGIFAGALPGVNPGVPTPLTACDLRQDPGNKLSLSFAGSVTSLQSSADLLIDPLGQVFDSLTGELVDGARVTMVNDATGLPAKVFGDDGVSSYPSSVITGSTVTDAGGWVYSFGTGGFRFPLAAPGRYRLVVEPPAPYTAPSVVTPERLQQARRTRSFLIVDASYGASFELSEPEPVRIDIPLDRPRDTGLVMTKEASQREATAGDLVQYRLHLQRTGADPSGTLTVTDQLPRGLRYRRGTTKGAAEPEVAKDGGVLTFRLDGLARNAATELTYLVEIAPGAPVGEAVNRAVAVGLGGASNEASAPVRIRPPLFTDALTVIGRVTEGGCGDPAAGRKGVPGIRIVMEDGSWTVTDRDGLYHLAGVRSGTHVVQLDTGSLPATHAPVTCDRDTRAAGSAVSRFVEGAGGSLQRVDFQLRPTGATAAGDRDGLPVAPADDATAAGNRADWLAQAAPGIGWLFPAADHNPRAPALRVVIRHRPGQRVALTVNGDRSDPLAFEGTEIDEARGVAISTWTGLPLHPRDNRLEARVLDADGRLVETLTRTVHYANLATRAELVTARSRLVADGLTRPLVAVRLTDRDGRPVRAGTPVSFRVATPYQAAMAATAADERSLNGRIRAEKQAKVVGDEGLAFLPLQPTTRAGEAMITVQLSDEGRTRLIEMRPWLTAGARDWVVVGFGRGTAGYQTLRRATALPREQRGEVVTDGQLALYAKGRIKGQWLLTMAYDSDREQRDLRDRGVFGTIDPDRYYTVYGDGSAQGFDAASRRKLYLRLERPRFAALFGDFETGMTATRLTRFNRTLTGGRADYAGTRVQATAFAAEDDGRYGRDEIQGNGLSGPYKLGARDLVPNSDKVVLETRDRLRSERIVESRALVRHIDYDIDSAAGTLRFREPILSRDVAGNPVFIVAEYELTGLGRKLVAGGRAAARIGAATLGAGVLRDESVGKRTVAGLDLRLPIDTATEVRAEAATGGTGGFGQAQAYLAEVEHHGSVADLLAYARRQESGFGLGQQNIAEAGTQKLGMDGRLRLGERLSLVGSAWQQEDLIGDARRMAGTARAEWRRDRGTLWAGAQMADDIGLDGRDRSSRLIELGGSQRVYGDRVEVTGQTGLALGRAESVDFPVRHALGIGWRVTPDVRLLAGHEIAQGDDFTAQTTRVGFEVSPWAGTRVSSTLNQGVVGENGARTFARLGLAQSLSLDKRWSVDATIDSSSTLSGQLPEGGRVSLFQPVAQGGVLGRDGLTEDFVSATLGATYRADLWSWNGRVEFREGSRDSRRGVVSNVLRSLGEGGTLAGSLRAFRHTDAAGVTVRSGSADVALAWRPLDSRWSLLDRFELKHEGAGRGASFRNTLAVPTFGAGNETTRAINNLAVNYRSGEEGSGHGLEAGLYYGVKYVAGRYADEKAEGLIDVAGVEVRHDIGASVDVGVQASVQHSWQGHALAFSGGPSIGASPGGNLWVSAGYNVAGYRDRDFEDARYTRAGPYLTLRFKLDQQSVGRAARDLGVGR